MCHVSRHMSCVTCHVSHVTIFLGGGGQGGEAYRRRVCYQRGLPRLYFFSDHFSPMPGTFFSELQNGKSIHLPYSNLTELGLWIPIQGVIPHLNPDGPYLNSTLVSFQKHPKFFFISFFSKVMVMPSNYANFVRGLWYQGNDLSPTWLPCPVTIKLCLYSIISYCFMVSFVDLWRLVVMELQHTVSTSL